MPKELKIFYFIFRFRKSHKSPPQEKKNHKIPWFSEPNPLILGLPSTVFPNRLFYKYLRLNSKNKQKWTFLVDFMLILVFKCFSV